MTTPAMRTLLRARAKKQWQNPSYKKYMTEKFLAFYSSNKDYREKNNTLLNKEQKKYWNDPAHRRLQAALVREFFANHPDRRENLRTLANKQWCDEVLRVWRRQKTKEQWTDTFRLIRKASYNKTYLQKHFLFSILSMKQEEK